MLNNGQSVPVNNNSGTTSMHKKDPEIIAAIV